DHYPAADHRDREQRTKSHARLQPPLQQIHTTSPAKTVGTLRHFAETSNKPTTCVKCNSAHWEGDPLPCRVDLARFRARWAHAGSIFVAQGDARLAPSLLW